MTSAVSDQSQFTSPIRRSNARVFAWILRQRVGKYGGRCVEERIGSFLVRKTQQASKGSLAMFCESSNWFRKVCSISGFVYCVFLCGTIKLEPKKPDALAGYSLCTAALFLASETQMNFFLGTTRLRFVGLIDEISTKRINIEEKIRGNFLSIGLRSQ